LAGFAAVTTRASFSLLPRFVFVSFVFVYEWVVDLIWFDVWWKIGLKKMETKFLFSVLFIYLFFSGLLMSLKIDDFEGFKVEGSDVNNIRLKMVVIVEGLL
jgi:hypothetical protein